MARRPPPRRPATGAGGVRAPSAPPAPPAAPRTPARPRMTAYGYRMDGGGSARVNAQGQQYTTQKAPGGVWHIYASGRRVFVRTAAPATNSAASAAAAPPDAGPGPETFTPDAAYAAEIARQAQERSQRLGQLAEEDTSDQTNYAEALRRFREQLPRQRRGALEQANTQGLAQSTVHSERVADIETNAARQESDMTGAYEGRRRAREEARRALLAGATIEEAAARAEAIERQYERISQRADEGSYTLNDPPAPAAAPESTAVARRGGTNKKRPQPKFKTVVKNNKVYRYYPNRQPVYVRPARRRPRRRG